MRYLFIFVIMILAGASCATPAPETPLFEKATDAVQDIVQPQEGIIALPVEEYANRRYKKTFGEYIQDRFTGYHVGDDVEFVNTQEEVPVYAIADGTVRLAETVSGYGGLIVVEHVVLGKTITALYGHVDIVNASVSKGDTVEIGQQMANLGDHESTETDGERKHLHFALYEGTELRRQGYEATPLNVSNWINPQTFFEEHGAEVEVDSRPFPTTGETGTNIFGDLSFTVPEGMEVEYVPSIESLNVYRLSGHGTARERSEIFIRYFDANAFLTLSTVDIFETEDLAIGSSNYTARRYDIQKKPGVTDFTGQPSWRNERHIVTDVRGEDGFTRYFVIAANPSLDTDVYKTLLDQIEISVTE